MGRQNSGGNSRAARSARAKLQLRDSKGRWIEMGRSRVSWYSSKEKKNLAGLAESTDGKNAIVRTDDGKRHAVSGRKLTIVDSKVTLPDNNDPQPKKQDGATPQPKASEKAETPRSEKQEGQLPQPTEEEPERSDADDSAPTPKSNEEREDQEPEVNPLENEEETKTPRYPQEGALDQYGIGRFSRARSEDSFYSFTEEVEVDPNKDFNFTNEKGELLAPNTRLFDEDGREFYFNEGLDKGSDSFIEEDVDFEAYNAARRKIFDEMPPGPERQAAEDALSTEDFTEEIVYDMNKISSISPNPSDRNDTDNPLNVDSAQTPQQISDALSKKFPGIQMDIDPEGDLEDTKLIAKAFDNKMRQYPFLPKGLRKFRIYNGDKSQENDKHYMGYVQMSSGRLSGVGNALHINNKYGADYHRRHHEEGTNGWNVAHLAGEEAKENPFKHVLDHETGHLLEDYAINTNLGVYKQSDIADAVDTYMNSLAPVDSTKLFRSELSQYAATNIAETIAESFAERDGMGDESRPLAKIVTSIIANHIPELKDIHGEQVTVEDIVARNKQSVLDTKDGEVDAIFLSADVLDALPDGTVIGGNNGRYKEGGLWYNPLNKDGDDSEETAKSIAPLAGNLNFPSSRKKHIVQDLFTDLEPGDKILAMGREYEYVGRSEFGSQEWADAETGAEVFPLNIYRDIGNSRNVKRAKGGTPAFDDVEEESPNDSELNPPAPKNTLPLNEHNMDAWKVSAHDLTSADPETGLYGDKDKALAFKDANGKWITTKGKELTPEQVLNGLTMYGGAKFKFKDKNFPFNKGTEPKKEAEAPQDEVKADSNAKPLPEGKIDTTRSDIKEALDASPVGSVIETHHNKGRLHYKKQENGSWKSLRTTENPKSSEKEYGSEVMARAIGKDGEEASRFEHFFKPATSETESGTPTEQTEETSAPVTKPDVNGEYKLPTTAKVLKDNADKTMRERYSGADAKKKLSAYRMGYKRSARDDYDIDDLDAEFGTGEIGDAAYDGYADYAVDKPFGHSWFQENYDADNGVSNEQTREDEEQAPIDEEPQEDTRSEDEVREDEIADEPTPVDEEPTSEEIVDNGPQGDDEPIDAPPADDVESDAVDETKVPGTDIDRTEPVALDGEKFPPTRQQQDVIDSVMAGKDTLVQAKAGAGKTTTLEAISRRIKQDRNNEQVLYIAFNKSVQTEAEGRMPDNVESRTGHSLAFQWAPAWMQERMGGGKDRTASQKRQKEALRRPDDIADHLEITDGINLPGDEKSLDREEIALNAVRTVDRYAYSADDAIGPQHLPEAMQHLPEEAQKAILDAADKAWQDLSSEDGQLKFTFDHSRKHWAMTRPDLSKLGSGNKKAAKVLFLDEAQDTPPVLAKVVADQNTQKVIVGDADQAIYGFTGAVDFLSQADHDVELPLNKSWRFGPQVADAGNRFLELLGSKGRVVGGGPESKITPDDERMADADAILTRSNAGMIFEIAKELENGRTVGVPKGTKADMKRLFNHANELMSDNTPKVIHEDLAPFRTWADFQKEVAKDEDPKIKMIDNIIKERGIEEILDLIEQVQDPGESGGANAGKDGLFGAIIDPETGAIAKAYMLNEHLKKQGTSLGRLGYRWAPEQNKSWIPRTSTPEGIAQAKKNLMDELGIQEQKKPDVVISTAHKAKGLEWGRVRIGDDFKPPKEDENTGKTRMPDPEELRLAYVAVTRAETELDPGSLRWVYGMTQDNGGDPDAKSEDNSSTEDTTPVEDTEEETPVEEVQEETSGREYKTGDTLTSDELTDEAFDAMPDGTVFYDKGVFIGFKLHGQVRSNTIAKYGRGGGYDTDAHRNRLRESDSVTLDSQPVNPQDIKIEKPYRDAEGKVHYKHPMAGDRDSAATVNPKYKAMTFRRDKLGYWERSDHTSLAHAIKQESKDRDRYDFVKSVAIEDRSDEEIEEDTPTEDITEETSLPKAKSDRRGNVTLDGRKIGTVMPGIAGWTIAGPDGKTVQYSFFPKKSDAMAKLVEMDQKGGTNTEEDDTQTPPPVDSPPTDTEDDSTDTPPVETPPVDDTPPVPAPKRYTFPVTKVNEKTLEYAKPGAGLYGDNEDNPIAYKVEDGGWVDPEGNNMDVDDLIGSLMGYQDSVFIFNDPKRVNRKEESTPKTPPTEVTDSDSSGKAPATGKPRSSVTVTLEKQTPGRGRKPVQRTNYDENGNGYTDGETVVNKKTGQNVKVDKVISADSVRIIDPVSGKPKTVLSKFVKSLSDEDNSSAPEPISTETEEESSIPSGNTENRGIAKGGTGTDEQGKFFIGTDGQKLRKMAKASYTFKGQTLTGTIVGVYPGSDSARIELPDGKKQTVLFKKLKSTLEDNQTTEGE